MAQGLCEAEDGKLLRLIGPDPLDLPTVAIREPGKAGHVVLARTLGVDGFPGREFEFLQPHRDGLGALAYEVHLHRDLALVPLGNMRKVLRQKITVELAIDTG